ncbi:hypothetical protein XIS1_530015 [Xenorhabdus innexi]|uniref:Uncharacterized protein n=1 Tax=Xenorhabdus innexi TaxID=290109 RepID=A0A1N6MZC4_9GAMM|nr:hypothetical protein XIS1_530015 [Xenorhabdus innexi]
MSVLSVSFHYIYKKIELLIDWQFKYLECITYNLIITTNKDDIDVSAMD